MIQEFSVQNFLSFQEKQTISFVATSDKTNLDELTVAVKPNLRLLRMGMIYGANASGKSNLLQAIHNLRLILLTPSLFESEEIQYYKPFKLTKNTPTLFEIIFWAFDRQFKYKVEFDNHSILYEKMEYTSDKGVSSLMYERKKGEEIEFGSTLGIKSRQKDDFNRDTLHNHTILSTLNKKNIEAPKLMLDVYEWIKSNMYALETHKSNFNIASQAEELPNLKKLILELLHKADFNIEDFNVFEFNISNEDAADILNDNQLPVIAKEMLLGVKKQVLFTHKTENNSYQIGIGWESEGTKAYFRLARVLYDLKQNGYVILEDELDNSLHYDLLVHYLHTFLQTPSKSQLIFATHNQLLMDENWMIRRDMVWFSEKDRATSSTRLFRASDMGLHKNVSLLNAYRIGKLGAKPLLGSTLLEGERE